MWNDIETTEDLLNFKIVADTVAQMIKNGNDEPISIGISGSWGTGKSSLVKMIGESLKNLDKENKYIFIDFNAWLYQGYDDARIALLQKVADKIKEVSESRKTCTDKVKEFIKRINWLRTAKLMASIATGIITDSAVKIAADQPQLLDDKELKSVPREIEDFRSRFQELLKELEVTLIVLVDDLDRCLPNTAISTLEAMRLLLFIPQTAFIIAADEQMIRNAVRSHFGNIDLSDDLVTSYFDKLIQIPLRVPRLGTNEVKGYLILLLADHAQRLGKIKPEEKEKGHNAIVSAIKKSWAEDLTKKIIEKAYGKEVASKLSVEIDLADQLANIMVTSDHIAGNPRLIKRFLNNLIIRESIAKAQDMSVSFEELAKLQLFERCASPVAFEYLVKQVGDSKDGRPEFLKELEEQVAKGEELVFEENSWNSTFISNWLKLNPPLSKIDLRPLLYLSRDKVMFFPSFDELSTEGQNVMAAICEADDFMSPLINMIKEIGENEAKKILTLMIRRVRKQQWDHNTIIQTLHIPKAFPQLAPNFIAMFDEIPVQEIKPALIPLLRDEMWANDLLIRWKQDKNSSSSIKKAINIKIKEKK
ncbi:MAG: NTPase KAP [Planctomycetes bacterium]|nr:NTPase KAP [Planctomycetota bacterium]